MDVAIFIILMLLLIARAAYGSPRGIPFRAV